MTCRTQANEVAVNISKLGIVLEELDVVHLGSFPHPSVSFTVLALVVVTLEDRRALTFPFGCEIERVRFVLHCLNDVANKRTRRLIRARLERI